MNKSKKYYTDEVIHELANIIVDVILILDTHPANGLKLSLNNLNILDNFINKDISYKECVYAITKTKTVSSKIIDSELYNAIYTILQGIFGIYEITKEPLEELISRMNETDAWGYIACCGRHMCSFPYESISEDIQFFMTTLRNRTPVL